MTKPLTALPCEHCNAACCRKSSASPYAVALFDYEVSQFPEAVLLPSSSGVKTYVLPPVNGKCINLDDDNHCKVYDARPLRCQQFSCCDGYLLRGKEHDTFLTLFPHVVPLLEIYCPDAVAKRLKESEARARAARIGL